MTKDDLIFIHGALAATISDLETFRYDTAERHMIKERGVEKNCLTIRHTIVNREKYLELGIESAIDDLNKLIDECNGRLSAERR